jgi:hypothetical protein
MPTDPLEKMADAVKQWHPDAKTPEQNMMPDTHPYDPSFNLPITTKGETAPEARGAANRAKMTPEQRAGWDHMTDGFQEPTPGTRGGGSDYSVARTARKSTE